jgi:acyl-CoA reductase-like NAD-dependent aldehyde dehydrogenase
VRKKTGPAERNRAVRLARALAQRNWRAMTGEQIERVLETAEDLHRSMRCIRQRRVDNP